MEKRLVERTKIGLEDRKGSFSPQRLANEVSAPPLIYWVICLSTRLFNNLLFHILVFLIYSPPLHRIPMVPQVYRPRSHPRSIRPSHTLSFGSEMLNPQVYRPRRHPRLSDLHTLCPSGQRC